jgi:hypothetical protein
MQTLNNLRKIRVRKIESGRLSNSDEMGEMEIREINSGKLWICSSISR